MLQDSAIPSLQMSAATCRARRARSGARGGRIAGLEAELSINSVQMKAWSAFANTLSANNGRLDTVDGVREHPFGRLEDRLAALSSMRQAGAVLFSALDVDQQRKAIQLLPLCCLPTAWAD